MSNAVQWFQIQGTDYKPLQAFYKKVFGWKYTPTPDGSGGVMVTPAPGGIAGGIGPTMDGTSKSVAVYVSVTDIQGMLEKVEGAGGQIAMPVMDLPAGMGKISGFVDPAGNFTGLWQPPPAPTASKKAAKKASKRASKKTAKKAAKKTAKRGAKKSAPKKPAKAAKKAAKKPAAAKKRPAKKKASRRKA